MEKEIKLWKEFKEDQSARYKAMYEDPEYKEQMSNIGLTGAFSLRLWDITGMMFKNKYGIVSQTYENFLDWAADDCPKFKGITVKHEIK